MKRILMGGHGLKTIEELLVSRNVFFISGGHTIFVPSRQEKYMLESVAKDWPDVDGNVLPMTPGEIARTELSRAFPDLKRVGWHKGHTPLLGWRWPMMYSGQYEGEGYYLDLIAAYHQLYKPLTLDIAFPRGLGQYKLRPVAARLKNNKAARNSLIGVIRSTQVRGVKGRKRFTMETSNKYLSPCLWAQVQAVLNEIAFLAVGFGAIYIATDGYMFPKQSNFSNFRDMLDGYGLHYRTHQGPLEIRGWGSYQTRERTTRLFERGHVGGKPFRQVHIHSLDAPIKNLEWWSVISERIKSN